MQPGAQECRRLLPGGFSAVRCSGVVLAEIRRGRFTPSPVDRPVRRQRR